MLRLLAIAIASVSNIVLTPMILKVYGPEGYATWAVTFGVTIALLAIHLGVPSAITKTFKELLDKPYHKALFIHAIKKSTLYSGALILLLSTIALIFYFKVDAINIHLKIAYIIAIESCLAFPLYIYLSAVRANNEYDVISYFEIGRVSLRFVFLILGILANIDILMLVLVSSVLNVVSLFILLISKKTHQIKFSDLVNSSFSLPQKYRKELSKNSLYSLVVNFMDNTRFRIDPVIFPLVLNKASTIEVSMLLPLAGLLFQVKQRLLSRYEPLFYSDQKYTTIGICLAKSITIDLMVFLMMAAFLKHFLVLWLSDNAQLLRIESSMFYLLTISIYVGFSTIFRYFSLSIGKLQFDVTISIIEFILKIAFLILLATLDQFHGYAFSGFMVYVFFGITVRLVIIKKHVSARNLDQIVKGFKSNLGKSYSVYLLLLASLSTLAVTVVDDRKILLALFIASIVTSLFLFREVNKTRGKSLSAA